MRFEAGQFDIVVIGAGHAGIEAALAAARLGCTVMCLCTNLDAVGNMPCNPSIGGSAKGQLVREIDALGGEMGRAADASCIQFRMLNRGKGPAVFSPRSQNDRMAYRAYMRCALESEPNLFLVQGECVEILTEGSNVNGVVLDSGAFYHALAVVLATGTFLGAKTFTGEATRQIGPDGLSPALKLTNNLLSLGLRIRRFKTGTPPRIDAQTVDFTSLEPQNGDENPQGFSYKKEYAALNLVQCHLAYTGTLTAQLVHDSLSRSPLYSGKIEGVGPRYCPSVEDKIMRFPDKQRHQLFLEPCAADSREIYLQGLSTSMPEDVQLALVRSVAGLENAMIMRAGYAIEYDCLDPLQLDSTLSVRHIGGLFAAGQVCGSSGYEEAAAQGLVAGINAAHCILNKPPFIMLRSDGYIGTLIDDLTTRGTDEPYRMMTSRCEHRLICRQDNADKRLMPRGYELGLISAAQIQKMEAKYSAAESEIRRLGKSVVPPSAQVNELLEQLGTAPLFQRGASLEELLRRPEIDYRSLASIDEARTPLDDQVIEQVEISIKYDGYIKRQLSEVEAAKKMENRHLPHSIDYMSIASIRTEARIKLSTVMPQTLGQASRISGVSPSDIGALIAWLSINEHSLNN